MNRSVTARLPLTTGSCASSAVSPTTTRSVGVEGVSVRNLSASASVIGRAAKTSARWSFSTAASDRRAAPVSRSRPTRRS